MGFKVFSALHREEKGREVVRFFEKQENGDRLWAMGLLPVPAEVANSIMMRLQQILHDTLFGEEAGENAEDNFENALKQLNEGLSDQLEGDIAEDILRKGALLVGFLHKEELLVSVYGQGEVFLLRDDVLTEITEGISPSRVDQEFFQNVSSGDLQNGDKLVFSTIRLQRSMTERQLSGIMSDGVTEAMESVKSLIVSGENGTVMILNIKSDEILTLPQIGVGESVFSTARETRSRSKFTDTLSGYFDRASQSVPSVKRNHLFLGGAIVIALFLMIFFFSMLSNKSSNQENMEYTDFVNTVEQEFSTVETRMLEGKADQANLILNRIEETAREMIMKRVDVENADRILQIVRDKREFVNNIMRINNPEVMSDLSAINEGVAARGLIFLKNEFLIFDKDSLYRILVSGEKPETLGIITSSDTVTTGTPFSSKDEAVFVTEGGSVLEWKDGQVISADTADTTWKNTVDIDTFSKYLYFLDPAENQIWKYERRDSGFTTAEGWVTGSADLSKAISMAIDGSVYVLTSNGEIQKYHRGERQTFEVKEAPGGTVTGDRIYTSETLEQIFVLDKNENRILIFNKSGSEAIYKQQIVLENTGPLVDIFANENQLYVLGESRVFKIALSQ